MKRKKPGILIISLLTGVIIIVAATSVSGRRGKKDGFFEDLGNGTIKDHEFGLIWQKGYGGGEKGLVWKDAIKYCRNLRLAGKRWKLPTIRQLRTLVIVYKNSSYRWYISKLFEKSPGSGYWSSTTYRSSRDGAWVVYFSNGRVDVSSKDYSYQVRCVAAGQ